MARRNYGRVIYNGIFFDRDQILSRASGYGTPLSKPIEYPHVTLQYRPSAEQVKAFQPLIGTAVRVTVSKYACDGKNEGFYVSSVMPEDPRITELLEGIPSGIPHITISVDGTVDPATGRQIGRPVNTYRLFDGSIPARVEDISPIILEGRLGEMREEADGRMVLKTEP